MSGLTNDDDGTVEAQPRRTEDSVRSADGRRGIGIAAGLGHGRAAGVADGPARSFEAA